MPQEKHSESSAVSDSDVKKLLAANIALTEEVLRLTRRTSRTITLMTIVDYIRFGLLITPFILAALYLPPYIRQILTWYERLGGT